MVKRKKTRLEEWIEEYMLLHAKIKEKNGKRKILLPSYKEILKQAIYLHVIKIPNNKKIPKEKFSRLILKIRWRVYRRLSRLSEEEIYLDREKKAKGIMLFMPIKIYENVKKMAKLLQIPISKLITEFCDFITNDLSILSDFLNLFYPNREVEVLRLEMIKILIESLKSKDG